MNTKRVSSAFVDSRRDGVMCARKRAADGLTSVHLFRCKIDSNQCVRLYDLTELTIVAIALLFQ